MSSHSRKLFPVLAVAPLWFLASCTMGPDYVKPDIAGQTPAKWKWQPAQPRDASPRGEWWTVFHDGELNRLQGLALKNNQDLRGSLARLDQARATLGVTKVSYAPDLSLQGSAQRQRTSGSAASPVPIDMPAAYLNSFSVPLALSYEIDLWGRLRRSVESVQATAESSAADYHNMTLSLNGEVASTYYLLRSFDTELEAIDQTIASQEHTLELIQQRFTAGTISETDVAKARSELANAKADRADVQRQRAETLSALAVLCGQPASTFEITPRGLAGNPPKIPAGVPASLLERRPDVASAERKVASTNADIGAAIAGYFPAVSLTGQAGFSSRETSSLFEADSNVWSIGPSVTLPITGAFTNKAKVTRARAANQGAIATYRQTVLEAVKDVETSLVQIQYRGAQSEALQDAAKQSAKATDLARQRYESGSVSYLELLDAQRTGLATERASARVQAQGFIATVRLIRALGGGW
jgi:multidrug efflux system outer membrane protein